MAMTGGPRNEYDDIWSDVPQDSMRRLTDLAARVFHASAELSVRDGDGATHVLSMSGEPITPAEIGPRHEIVIAAQPCEQSIGTLAIYAGHRTWSDDDGAVLRDIAGTFENEIALRREATFREEAVGNLPGLVFERRKSGPTQSRTTILGSTQPALSTACLLPEDGSGAAWEAVHPDDRDRVRMASMRSLVEEGDLDLTFRIDTATGLRWVRNQQIARREAGGTIVWSGLCSDVTDIVASRRDADRQALVDTNHELRTPLQAIVGSTEFLKTEQRPEVIRAHARTIQAAAESLLEVINTTLDTGEAEANGAQPVDLREFAETCLSLIAPQAIEKRLDARLLIDASAPTRAIFARAKVKRIVLNLLNNAVKFTDEGGLTLRIGGTDGALRFEVSDTGMGIPDDERALLFQRFSRLDAPGCETDGSGLGLSIVKALVASLGGRIEVNGNEGGGTSFAVEIPVAADHPVATVEAAEPPEAEAEAPARRILLADDLDLNRKLISDMLSLDGHVVDSVADGAAAVEAAKEQRYDLILMDMIMPGMDGIEATRAIRALAAPACDVPIVALTAHSFREQLDNCLHAGMDATLTKPMSLEALTSAVTTWSRGRRQAA